MRTSSTDQNLSAQIAAILDFIHAGETLVVTRIDRLARSLRDLQVIVDRLKAKGAHLLATEQPVDTSTATGKAFFDMPGVFAEFETNLRRERQARELPLQKRAASTKAGRRRSTVPKSCVVWNRATAPHGSPAILASRVELSIRCGRGSQDEQRQAHNPSDTRGL